jgi:hypothetical protein
MDIWLRHWLPSGPEYRPDPLENYLAGTSVEVVEPMIPNGSAFESWSGHPKLRICEVLQNRRDLTDCRLLKG